jgi:hypothetical protein
MRAAAAVLVVSCLAVASGCGGDDANGGSDEARTRAAYIAQADAICRRANAGIAATNARISQINRTATDAQRALSAAAPLLAGAAEAQRASFKEFRALTPPAGDADTVARMVAGIEEQVAVVGQVADAAAAGDVERMQTLGTQLPRTRDRVRSLLQGYGFKECGRADA